MFGRDRKKLDRLENEVDELRKEVALLRIAARIRVYEFESDSYTRHLSYFGSGPLPSATMDASFAIQQLAGHVGLKFEYVKGNPESVILGKASDLAKKK